MVFAFLCSLLVSSMFEVLPKCSAHVLPGIPELEEAVMCRLGTC